ncbi:hypothetical protein SO802_024912 [Lithocarpus litseifolius]|uniref:RNase H type-1 domain-containing protein n=1 Tax=Lithocarpus litseifolius TaxID=425828 RepID=A0AAW2CE97_9ROSI
MDQMRLEWTNGLKYYVVVIQNEHSNNKYYQNNAMDVFLNPNYQNNVVSPILDDCKQLVLQFRQVQFSHCYHQANWCADMLARMSMDQVADFISFDCPLVDIRSILGDDVVGLYVNRVCSVTDVAV